LATFLAAFFFFLAIDLAPSTRAPETRLTSAPRGAHTTGTNDVVAVWKTAIARDPHASTCTL
jgi:hypothetical protein